MFYFLLIRPQQQRQKEMKRSLSALKRGDRVVTGGGVLGTVQRVREGSNEVELEIAPNVRVTVLRETISSVLKPTRGQRRQAGARTEGQGLCPDPQGRSPARRGPGARPLPGPGQSRLP